MKYLGWAILIVIGVIVFYFLTLFAPRPWEDTLVDIYTQDCGGFSLTLSEERRINRFEGSGVTYYLNYDAASKKERVEYLGDNLLGGVDPMPINTKIPVRIFETPGVGADRENSTEYRTIYVSPKNFSREDYEQISTCLQSNIEAFHAAFKNHLSKVSKTDGSMGIYRNNGVLRIIGTAYADQQGFYEFMASKIERGTFRNESLGEISIGFNGVVESQFMGYLGNYFELIPENDTSSLREFDFKNEEGRSLIEYLEKYALKANEYNP